MFTCQVAGYRGGLLILSRSTLCFFRSDYIDPIIPHQRILSAFPGTRLIEPTMTPRIIDIWANPVLPLDVSWSTVCPIATVYQAPNSLIDLDDVRKVCLKCVVCSNSPMWIVSCYPSDGRLMSLSLSWTLPMYQRSASVLGIGQVRRFSPMKM